MHTAQPRLWTSTQSTYVFAVCCQEQSERKQTTRNYVSLSYSYYLFLGNLELFDTDGECILQSITQAVGSVKQYGRWCTVCPYREWPPTRGGSLHSSSVEQLCLLWSHPRFLPPGEGHQLINSTGTYLEVVLLKQPFFELANACKCHRITFVDWNCDSIQLVPHMLNYVPTTFQKLRFFC